MPASIASPPADRNHGELPIAVGGAVYEILLLERFRGEAVIDALRRCMLAP